MIRRSPAEYYIKYLLVLPEQLSDDDVVRTLRDYQLDYPGRAYLARLRSMLRTPVPFYPRVESHVPSYKFLQRQKIHKLFFRDGFVDGALALLEHPRSKELVESLLLVGESNVAICARLHRLGVTSTPKTVEYYKHFFMNVDLVDRAEMRALMDVRVEDMTLQTSDPEALIRYKALRRAMYADPRYMAVTTTSPELAGMRLQLRHGLMPNRIQYTRLAEVTRTTAIIATLEAMSRGGPEASIEARNFATVAREMDTILRDSGVADATAQKDMQSVVLGTSSNEPRPIGELTGGQYTESVQMEDTMEASRAK